MLENLLGALIQQRFGDIRRRAAGAVIESAALGMAGLATVFLFVALQMLLATRMDGWLAALVVAGLALLLAVILALVGRSLLRRRQQRQHQETLSSVEETLVLLSRALSDGDKSKEGAKETGPALVGAALAAGIMLGRAQKR